MHFWSIYNIKKYVPVGSGFFLKYYVIMMLVQDYILRDVVAHQLWFEMCFCWLMIFGLFRKRALNTIYHGPLAGVYKCRTKWRFWMIHKPRTGYEPSKMFRLQKGTPYLLSNGFSRFSLVFGNSWLRSFSYIVFGFSHITQFPTSLSKTHNLMFLDSSLHRSLLWDRAWPGRRGHLWTQALRWTKRWPNGPMRRSRSAGLRPRAWSGPCTGAQCSRKRPG